jgi:hypothetical protein
MITSCLIAPLQLEKSGRLLYGTQYSMGRNSYARTPWERFQLRRALKAAEPDGRAESPSTAQ